jgi:ribosome maturation factor RimP
MVSRAVEAELDALDPIEQPYCLCVSSPGLDRPFRKEADYKRAMGKEIEVKLFAPIKGKKSINGILKNYNDVELTLEVEQGEIALSRSGIAQVRPYIKF